MANPYRYQTISLSLRIILWPLTVPPNFFSMPTDVDWLYDIAFPARVDVTHRAQHLISSVAFHLCEKRRLVQINVNW